MTKEERFIECRLRERAHRHGSRRSDGHRGSMSDMNLVLHQSVAINAKGGYFLLFGVVVIDVNPRRKSGRKFW
jgi:hypothetical protein